jgi:hypothetical protein
MSEKEREGKPENIIRLEEPSLVMTTHLKIKTKCSPKATNTFYL